MIIKINGNERVYRRGLLAGGVGSPDADAVSPKAAWQPCTKGGDTIGERYRFIRYDKPPARHKMPSQTKEIA